jgi:spermidine/putrescine transport system substrate-binding protein
MSDRPNNPPPGVFTRRQFLYIAGGTVAAATAGGVLAACSSEATSAPTLAPTAVPSAAATSAPTAVPSAVATASAAAACPSLSPSTAKVGGPLNLFEWEGYDGKGVQEWTDWYKKNNISLNVKYISNENMTAFMKSPSGKDWDAASLSESEVPHAYESGVCSPISVEEVPALAKMYPFFREGELWKLCDGVYAAVPWSWGPIAIVANTDKVPADALVSYEGLFDPKWKGRIGAFDDGYNMVATASVATGHNPSALTREQLNGPVRDWLKRLMPQTKALVTSVGDQANVLGSGDVWIMLVGWAYFVPTLKDQGVVVDFRVPKEGAYGFADSIFIPPSAPDRQNAIAWINAMMEGDTARAINEWTVQMSSNPEVNAKVSPDIRGLFPADVEPYLSSTLKWNHNWYDPNGSYATMDEWIKLWTDVKAGV